MDDLKIPSILFLIWDIKRAIEKNLSLHEGLKSFLLRPSQDSFSRHFSIWLQSKQAYALRDLSQFNSHQTVVLNIIQAGLSGQGIYEQIKSIEAEFIELCESDIQEHAAKLPLLLQFPLIFMIFPAICMLLIIPTLSQLSF
jgi:hypothetical protein